MYKRSGERSVGERAGGGRADGRSGALFPKPPKAFPKSSPSFILDPWGPLGDSKISFRLPKTFPEPRQMFPKPPQNPGHQLDFNFCTPFQHFLQKVVFLRETSSLCYMKKSMSRVEKTSFCNKYRKGVYKLRSS